MTLAAGAEWLFSVRVYREHDRPFAAGAALHWRALFAVAVVTMVGATGSLILAANA
jgi:hypothetical protein